jgi:subtilisin family serine protease
MLSLIFIQFFFVNYAATIAIIDSGFDIEHEFIKNKIYQDKSEEDELKKIDLSDNFHGWRIDKEASISSQDLTVTIDQEIFEYKKLKAKSYNEGLTPLEIEWMKEKRKNPEFRDKLKIFKKVSHGTFVASIAAHEGDIEILPIKGLRVKDPVYLFRPNIDPEDAFLVQTIKAKNIDEQMPAIIDYTINRMMIKFHQMIDFIAQKHIRIVNSSYGISEKKALSILNNLHFALFEKEIPKDLEKKYLTLFFDEIIKRANSALSLHPNTIYIFSAGNTAHNTDEVYHFPSRVNLPNTLSIAASNGDYLAVFSNYGKKTVDFAAPGVGLNTLIPSFLATDKNQTVPISGTSMAAPYVANLVAQILDINPSLTATEVIQMIIETGTKHIHLMEKLKFPMVVNKELALKAAKLSLTNNLLDAIRLANIPLVKNPLSEFWEEETK